MTENEKKFVLTLDSEKKIIDLASEHYQISQGYLLVSRGVSLRLRSSEAGSFKKNGFCGDGHIVHYLTFKSTVNGGRVVEIEKKIDKRDFSDLWGQSLNKLIKFRHILKNNDEAWEIDYFKDHNFETYFAMAEIEMPENQVSPKKIPDFIKQHLVHEVLSADCRFSSKLLGDVRSAIELRKSFEKG